MIVETFLLLKKDYAKQKKKKKNQIINNQYIHYLESKQNSSPLLDTFSAARKTLNHIILYVFHSCRVIKCTVEGGG